MPLLVVVATDKRSGDCHKAGAREPRGMWRYAAAALDLDAARPPPGSCYVGDAAGRPGDHGDDVFLPASFFSLSRATRRS